MNFKTFSDDDYERCEVEISKSLAKMVKPYQGCPRGADGVPGPMEKTVEEYFTKWMSSYKDYILKGTDDEFVFIPKTLYEHLLRHFQKREAK